jgi:hypothetical protein
MAPHRCLASSSPPETTNADTWNRAPVPAAEHASSHSGKPTVKLRRRTACTVMPPLAPGLPEGPLLRPRCSKSRHNER